jgi:hypothetical protein
MRSIFWSQWLTFVVRFLVTHFPALRIFRAYKLCKPPFKCENFTRNLQEYGGLIAENPGDSRPRNPGILYPEKLRIPTPKILAQHV